MGKFMALMLAAALSAAFLYRDDPRVSQACGTVAYHAKGIARQMGQDAGDLKKLAADLAPAEATKKK